MKTSSEYKARDYEFGILTQNLRAKAALTQTELASLVGVSKKAVLNWEAGLSYPHIRHLRILVETFLEKGCFTPYQERNEAEIFWDKATRSKTDVKDAFIVEWFNSLFHKEPGLLHPVPVTLYQNLNRLDLSEIVDVRSLYGRERELAELENWLIKDKLRVISLLGIGGIGKTGLAVTLAHQVVPHFDYVIFRSLQNAPTLAELLDSILKFLLNNQLAELPVSQNEKLGLLMSYFRQYRCLLILDNFETIMQDGLEAGEYREDFTGYSELVKRLSLTAHQSSLLITSREKLRQLALREEKNGVVRSLALRGLDKKSCQAVLNSMNIKSEEEDGAILVERYGGNPLALKLIAEPVRVIFGGNTRAFLASENFHHGELTYILDQHFKRLSTVEQDILYWLALSREPLEVETIQKHSVLQLGSQTFVEGIQALLKRFLIEQTEEKDNPGFTLQGVVIEYVTERLIDTFHQEIINRTPNLLYRYLLLQTQTREHIRQTQVRVILAPLLAQLKKTLKRSETVIERLRGLLSGLRKLPPTDQLYAPANLLNLLVQTGADLSGWDLSGLALGQSYLVGVDLKNVDMSGADLHGTAFTESYLSAYGLAFSPDGQTVAAGLFNGVVKLWEVGKVFGSQLQEYRGHTNLVGTVAFSPDGKVLATGSADGVIRLWEPQSGHCLAVLQRNTSSIYSVTFSPDSNWLASGGTDQSINIWQVSSGRLVATISDGQGWVMFLAFSPDGKLLASGGFDGTIKLWDVANPQPEFKYRATLTGHYQWIHKLAFSPDSKLLASSGDQTVRLWIVDQPQQPCKTILKGHTGSVLGVAFSPDGEIVASSDTKGKVIFWTVNNSTIQKSLVTNTGAITNLAFNPDGETFITSSPEFSNVTLRSVKDLEVLDVLKGYSNLIYTLAVDPQGKWLVVGGIDNSLLLWDLTKPLETPPIRLTGHNGFICALAFSPDGNTIASGGSDGTIKLWNLANNKCWRTFCEYKKQLTNLAFSSDGRFLISGDEEGTLKVWSLINGKELGNQPAHRTRIRKLTLSPDYRFLATGGEDGFIRLWKFDAETGTIEPVGEWPSQSELVMTLAFDPSGKGLFSGGSDGAVRSWDVTTGECCGYVQAHNGLVWAIAYSPHAKELATAGEDGLVRVWKAEQAGQLELIHSFKHGGRTTTISFNPKENYLYSGGESGKIRIWDLSLESNAPVKTISAPLPYQGLNIQDVTGLTEAQRLNLLNLGAIETPD